MIRLLLLRSATVFILACGLGLVLCRPVLSQSVVVLAPASDPGDQAACVRFAQEVVESLGLYKSVRPTYVDVNTPVIKQALHARTLQAAEVRDPAGFGSAIHIGQVCGADYVVYGSFSTQLPNAPSRGPEALQLLIAYVGATSVSPLMPPVLTPGPNGWGDAIPVSVAPPPKDTQRQRGGRHQGKNEQTQVFIPAWIDSAAVSYAEVIAARIGAISASLTPEGGGDASAHWAKAQNFLSSDKITEAAGEMALAIDLDPLNATYKASLASILLKRGQTAGAVALYQDATAAAPFDVDIRLGLGSALEADGDFVGAKEAYREAIRLAPDRASAHTLMGKLLMRQGHKAEGMAELELGARRQDVAASDAITDAMIQSGDLDKASVRLQQAIIADPKRVYPRLRLAYVLSTQKHLRQALVAWGDAMDAGLIPDISDRKVMENVCDSQLMGVLGSVKSATPDALADLKKQAQRVAGLLDQLSAASGDTKLERQRSAAAYEALQAISDRIQAPDDQTTTGEAGVLVSNAQQLISQAGATVDAAH